MDAKAEKLLSPAAASESAPKRPLDESLPDEQRHKRYSFADDYGFGDEFGFGDETSSIFNVTPVYSLPGMQSTEEGTSAIMNTLSSTSSSLPRPLTSQVKSSTSSSSSGRERPVYSVLVIDDSVVQRKVTRNLLSGDIGEESWIVHTAENGERAIEYIESTRKVPDIIIVDQIMSSAGGVMLGHEVVAALRKRSHFKEVIIIGCSSFASEASRYLHEAGCDGVWAKPMPSKDIIYEQIGEIRRLKYLQRCMEGDSQHACPTPALSTPAVFTPAALFSPPMLFSPPPERAYQYQPVKPKETSGGAATALKTMYSTISNVKGGSSSTNRAAASAPPPPLPPRPILRVVTKSFNPQVLSDAVAALATGENTGITTIQSDSESSTRVATPDDWYTMQMRPVLPPGDHVARTFNTRSITDVLMSVSASLANSEAASVCGGISSASSSIPVTPEDMSDVEDGSGHHHHHHRRRRHSSSSSSMASRRGGERGGERGGGGHGDNFRWMVNMPMVMRGMHSLVGSKIPSRMASRRESRQPSRQQSRQASCQPSRRPSACDDTSMSMMLNRPASPGPEPDEPQQHQSA